MRLANQENLKVLSYIASMGSGYRKLHFRGWSIGEAAMLWSLVVRRSPVNTEDLLLWDRGVAEAAECNEVPQGMVFTLRRPSKESSAFRNRHLSVST
jgi:hypothetical protein